MIAAAMEILRRHLDRAGDSGRRIAVWWRDDDAVAATPALERLLRLSEACEAPLALACIPARIRPDLPSRLDEAPRVHVLPHGYAHASHEEPGRKNAEFGPARPGEEVRRDLDAARTISHARFGRRVVDLFVPPWNRFAAAHLPLLAATGYRGISTFGRKSDFVREDLLSCPTHLDPVDWRRTRSLAEPGAVDAMMADALGAGGARLGLLTHHLAFDDRLWAFLEEALALFRLHPAATLVSVDELMRERIP